MSKQRALLSGLMVWLGYVGMRTLLQRLLPASDWNAYFCQDIAITLVRLACGLACLWIARKRWLDSALGLSHGAPLTLAGWAAAFVAFAAMTLEPVSQAANHVQPWWMRLGEIGIALIVAFNEEVGYRALAYNGLRELWGRAAAIMISSLLFMLMHAGYQHWEHLPKVFLIGLIFGLLRDRGMSLYSLILLHFVIDAVPAALLPGPVLHWQLYYQSAWVAALAVVIAFFSPTRIAAAGESLLFAYGSLRPGEKEARDLNVLKRCDLVGEAQVQGRISATSGYPLLRLSKKAAELVPGVLLRLRDRDFLATLDAYEGDDYVRDKALIQMKDGTRCESWIYVAARGPAHVTGR